MTSEPQQKSTLDSRPSCGNPAAVGGKDDFQILYIIFKTWKVKENMTAFGWLRAKTGSVAASVFFHWECNILWIYSCNTNYLVIQCSYTGGNYGLI